MILGIIFLITGLGSALMVGRIAFNDITERKPVNFKILILWLSVFLISVFAIGMINSF